MDRNPQKGIPPQFQVIKVYPQRGDLLLHRLAKATLFICNRCSLGKTSKLVAFAKDKWDEPMCNGCYGYLISSETKGGAGRTQDNLVGGTARKHSQRSPKIRKAKKAARQARSPTRAMGPNKEKEQER
ncbi:hypothetical protein N431DRAFT_429992 [Stipitochalara longipes BDJ]|nr:hypothetical protein N431DRAFT_429992 [Stipitochalara longipes BDJ]